MNRRVRTASAGQGETRVNTPATTRRLPPTTAETAMTPDVILALYDWWIGSCFRCGEAEVFVTHLDDITTPRGERSELAACGCCVLTLENERRRYALRRRQEYRPGRLGS